MESTVNALNWFEIPVYDFDRAKAFYSQVMGFDMPESIMGFNRMGYFQVDKGGIGGAIVQGPGYTPSRQGALVYLNSGENLNSKLTHVIPAGGSIELDKTLITPELGYYAIIIDTEGNRIALHSMK